MKNYIKTITLLLLSSIFISSSCKKNTPTNTEEQLPPETHIGANTFGCKVDGKVYKASGEGGLLADEKVRGGGPNSDSSILIIASNSKQKFNLNLSVKYNGNLGILFTSSYPYKGNFKDNTNGTLSSSTNEYITDNIHLGKVNIKYLNMTNIAAGTFEMDAVNANGKVIHITEGRFDIRF